MASVFFVLFFWLLGEGVSRVLGLMPGSLWGMALLFLSLRAGLEPRHLRPAAPLLLRWMPLFFVPVGVGAVTFFDLPARALFATLTALFLGTLFTLAASGVWGRR